MEPIPSCHVVAVPYPGRGHINPMLNLCTLLLHTHNSSSSSSSSLHRHHLQITFVLTQEWVSLLPPPPPGIHFSTIPNVLPSELNRAADMPTFVSSTQTKMLQPFTHLLNNLPHPVHFIIADACLSWAVDFANHRNIPLASFWAMPASVFSVFYNFDLIVRNGDHPVDLSERGNDRIDYIPGIQSIRLADLPSIVHMADQRLINLVLATMPAVSKAQYLLFTTIHAAEPLPIEAVKRQFPFPVYTFGPAIPYLSLQASASKAAEEADYFDWLDAQPANSVLYVALGSFLSVSAAQMDEIADGLRESGVRFLWVARGEAERLQRRCGDGGNGRVVAWCDQLKVLCHGSVGGFWTHCGWNSTMEAMYAGVPVLAFPIMMDQMPIRKHIVEDWKIGWDVRKGGGSGDFVEKQDIVKIIKECMDLESVERQGVVERVKKLQEATVGATTEGGSSVTNLASLLNDILSFAH